MKAIKMTNHTILYAEDEIQTRLNYTKILQRDFKEVYSCKDGLEAYEQYLKHEPNILLLDINMPKINGLEVANKIRKDDANTKIVLLTARSDKDTLKKAIELGLTTYLEKPITREDLKSTLIKLSQSFNDESITPLWYVDGYYYIWNNKIKELRYKDKFVFLTKQEISLLNLFIVSKQRHISYQDIYETVWYDDFSKEFKESTIKTMISCLRKKLPPKSIKNTYGLGYSINIY